MEKKSHIIQNRHGLKMVVDTYILDNAKDLVFIQHGLSGHKEQPHIKKMSDVFLKNNINVVVFDATHSWGDSDGNTVYLTPTTHYHDLEDVIFWAEAQEFYREPFILAGHSMGGLSCLLYTLNYPKRIKALAPLSTGVSGKLFHEIKMETEPQAHRQWEETGKWYKISKSNPEKSGDISWNFMTDYFSYDMLERAYEIAVPVLLMTADNDDATPYKHQKLLHDVLPNSELHLVENSSHTFKTEQALEDMANHLDTWIKKIS